MIMPMLSLLTLKAQMLVRSESLTAILGAKFGANKEFQIYGGPVAQRIKADVDCVVRAYGPATNYTSHVSRIRTMVVAGVSYNGHMKSLLQKQL